MIPFVCRFREYSFFIVCNLAIVIGRFELFLSAGTVVVF
jgi:hypothetical protein